MTATFTPPLAALTTVFTPPCPITWLLTTTKVPSQMPPFPSNGPASCDPPSWDEYLPQRGFEYYSPAICPSGFYVGPSCVITNPRTAQGFPAIQGGETAAYCIPNGHTCTSDTSDFRGGVWGVSRTATVNGAQVTVGPAIQIRWREEDLNNLETDPLTPGPRSTQPSSTQPSSTQITPVETSTDTDQFSTPDPTTTSTQRLILPILSSTSSTTTVPRELTPIQSSVSSVSSSSSTSSASASASALASSSSAPAPPSSTITQESQPSTAPTTSAPSSGQQSTDVDAPAQAKGRGGNGGSSSNFTVAAIVLTGILIAIIATYSAYATLRRYRRYRAGETEEFFVFQVEAWVRGRVRMMSRRRGQWGGGGGGSDSEKAEEDGGGDMNRRRRRKMPDAELGTEGPLPELGSSQPFGTKENPAELPTVDRSSWRSRVSRIFVARSQQGGKAGD
ncbi:hypothetical protein F5Y12DRAFT_195512 [Xylaria sp. FL1777]|nr:hypothetical protein F5Y12DRAFT_195512 [Xylaria sp. FL1777]